MPERPAKPTISASVTVREVVRTFWPASYSSTAAIDSSTVSGAPSCTEDRHDTSKPGNSNAGHLYGTSLPPDVKRALLEYLKTL